MPRAKRKMDVAPEQYGEGAELSRAQEQVPAGPAVTNAPMPVVTPDMVPNLSAPTMRPDEPLMAGMPTGPGKNYTPGPLVENQTLNTLRALYQRNPSVHLRRLIQKAGG